MKLLVNFMLLASLLGACVENSAPVPNTDYPSGESPENIDEASEQGPELRELDANEIKGGDDSFEFATWNIEQFPKRDQQTIAAVAGHIRRWQLDVLALQEVVSEKGFKSLVEQLDGYDGVLVNSLGDLRLGLIYKKSDFELVASGELAVADRNAFPRKPFSISLKKKTDGGIVEFVNVHLKAKGGDSNIDRRYRANKELFDYAKAKLARNSAEKIILLGDFNAELESKEMQFWQNSGTAFNIETLDLDAAGRYTYVKSYLSLIDHIVTANLTVDETIIPEPLIDIELYKEVISDHLPVIAIDR